MPNSYISVFLTIIATTLIVAVCLLVSCYHCKIWARGYNATVVENNPLAKVCFVKMQGGQIVNANNYRDAKVQ